MLAAADHLLFQGDSITNAFRMPEERNDAYQMGAGYALMIAACLQAIGQPAGLRCTNRGISGNRIPQLEARWQADCLNLQPTVLSLLIGTNDTMAAHRGEVDPDPDAFARDYAALLDRTRAAMPDLRLVLIEPFMLPVDLVDARVMSHLYPRQRIVRDLAVRYDARFVPLQDRFTHAAGADPAAWIYDGIHPTARGFWLIAATWLDAVAGIRLPSP